MRRVVLVTVIVAAVLAAAGCATTRTAGPAGPAANPPASPGGGPTTAAPSERAAIYTAMLRRYLSSGESSFPGGFPVVYVLDTARADASPAPRTTQPAAEVIPAEDQLAIENGLRDLGKIVFVANRDDVIENTDRCAQVRDGGILVTFAPLTGATGVGTDRVEVGIYGFVACLGATWLTYVVERKDGRWIATGTTGPMAIA